MTSVDISPAEESPAITFRMALPAGVPDTYKPVPDTTQGFWRSICRIRVIFSTGVFYATGTIVGKHHVLTAAHNVFDPRRREWARSIQVMPGYNGGKQPFQSTWGVKLISMRGYTQYKDTAYDLAFVITREDIGTQTGWPQMMAADNTNWRGENVHIAGYPSEANYDGESLQDTPCNVIRVDANMVYYRTNTYSGLSGAPIFLRRTLYGNWGTQAVIVGVHTTGSENENYGPKIRSEIWNWVLQSLAMTNSSIAGLWLMEGSTFRITLNGDHVTAIYERVNPEITALVKPGEVEFLGTLNRKTITGQDVVFYGFSNLERQCGIAGTKALVDILLTISEDQKTMTGVAWYPIPDAYCRVRLVERFFTFTKN